MGDDRRRLLLARLGDYRRGGDRRAARPIRLRPQLLERLTPFWGAGVQDLGLLRPSWTPPPQNEALLVGRRASGVGSRASLGRLSGASRRRAALCEGGRVLAD